MVGIGCYKMKHLLSVIIPVYNTGKYVEKCIDSVINQTYKDLEIILIDDGSTDDSYNVLTELEKKDNRIKIITQMNQGVSKTRNKGIEIAQGDLIAFVDSDDCLDLDMYEILIKNLDNTNADASACALIYDYNYEKMLPQTGKGINADVLTFEGADILLSLTRKDNSIEGLTPNKIYRRTIIGEHRFDEKIRMCEDSLFAWSVLRECTKVCYTPAQMYHYYIRNNSSTRTANVSIFFEAMEAYNRMLETDNIPEQTYTDLKTQYMNLNVAAFRCIVDKKDKMAYFKIKNNIDENYQYMSTLDKVNRIEAEAIRRGYYVGGNIEKIRRILSNIKRKIGLNQV